MKADTSYNLQKEVMVLIPKRHCVLVHVNRTRYEQCVADFSPVMFGHKVEVCGLIIKMNFFESLFLDRKLTGRGMFSTWCKQYEILDLNFLLESGYPSSFSAGSNNQNIILRAKEFVTNSHPESWWLIDEISNQLKPTWIFLPVELDKPFEVNVSRLAQIRSQINSPLGIYWKYEKGSEALFVNLARDFELPIYLETDGPVVLREEDYQFIHFVEFTSQVSESIQGMVRQSFEGSGVSPVFVDSIESSESRKLEEMYPVSFSALGTEKTKSLVDAFEREFGEALEDSQLFSLWPKFVRQNKANLGLDGPYVQAVDLEYSLIQVLRSAPLSKDSASPSGEEFLVANPLAVIMATELDFQAFFRAWRGIDRQMPQLSRGKRTLLGLSKSLDNKIKFTELNEPMAFVLDLIDDGKTPISEVHLKAGQVFVKSEIDSAIDTLRSRHLIL